MRASSEDDFYKAGWWNGIDDPEAGLKAMPWPSTIGPTGWT